MFQAQSRMGRLSRGWVIGLLSVALGAMLVWGQEDEPRKANLDNDSSEGDLETFEEDASLAAGQFSVANLDSAGNFSALKVGVAGGGAIFGWNDLDGESSEVELVASDPTLESGKVRVKDVNDDRDPEVIWVGTKGSDVNDNGKSDEEEFGSVAGVNDINGDQDAEIVVLDASRQIGRFFASGFDINARKKDGIEVIWVGLLHENGRSRAATFEGVSDVEGDGDDEVLLRDIRITSDSGLGGQAIDIDRDGDDDIIIRR